MPKKLMKAAKKQNPPLPAPERGKAHESFSSNEKKGAQSRL